METLNNTLFLLINANEQSPGFLLTLSTFLAEWLIYSVPLMLVYLWVRGSHQDRVASVTATMGVLFALECGQIINMLWPHPRPFMIGLGHTFLAHKQEASFPSDHAIVFFTLGLGFLLTSLRKLGSLILLLGVVVGWSRIYLGVHFPFDIAGAFLVAVPSTWLVVKTLRWRNLNRLLVERLEPIYQRLLS